MNTHKFNVSGRIARLAMTAAAAFAMAACSATYPHKPELKGAECVCAQDPIEEAVVEGNTISVPINVRISEDGAGGYTFRYSGLFTDPEGNLNFSVGRANKRDVIINFKISQNSVEGIRFKQDGREAMYIALKSDLDDPEGSPQKPYEGKQFSKFETSRDGRTLTVFNANNDSKVYRFSLRFDLNGKTVVHDPDDRNGGGHD